MKFISIPFNVAFLEILAKRWIDEHSSQQTSIKQGMIVVPNQRTAKALINTFLKVTQGAPVLLPRIVSIGAIDESALILKGNHGLTLPPAVNPTQRIAILTMLIMRMESTLGNGVQAGEAWKFACSLAELMDEAEWADCDLQECLPKAVEDEYAQHWQNILQFLTIITEVWPQWLTDNHVMNPVARKVALLRAQAELWIVAGSKEAVWAVGFIDARPAVVELLSAIIGLPKGRFIVSGIEQDLSDDIWKNLSLTHPYAEMAKMLCALEIERSEFQSWDEGGYQLVDQSRVSAFQQVLLPAEALEQWLVDRKSVHLDNLFLSNPIDQQQEAVSIALMIRDALEMPNKRVALVTSDRNLAMRVALELGRWGIIADDSAGEPLYKIPPAILLSLILRACIEQFTPVSLLSLLKHPLVCCGYAPNLCREYSRLLEINILRQFAASGLDAILHAVDKKGKDAPTVKGKSTFEQSSDFLSVAADLTRLLHSLSRFVAPLMEGSSRRSLDQWVIALVKSAEALVSNEDQVGAEVLWGAEEGNALAEHLRNLIAEAKVVTDITLQEFESILTASYTGIIVHTRRVLRGKKEKELHPRVYIWGLIEARLQVVDMVILGGLSEGVWPPVIDSGPWISRPMRIKIGIPLPDAEVGRSAYDFMSICCSVPEVVLSSPLRRDNAPVVQSRWITRLKAWLTGRNSFVPAHPALGWSKVLDQPTGSPTPITYPKPSPPLSLRPKSMSITDVEYWLKDPYEIYAKKVLKLRKIPGLDEDRSASIFGNMVHDGLNQAYTKLNTTWDKQIIETSLLKVLEERRDVLPSMRQWWRARVIRIAEWVFQEEQKRRTAGNFKWAYLEQQGEYNLSTQEGLTFTIRGIADRIDLNCDGTVEIFDYKTGNVPSAISVKQGLSPQLPLEAIMVSKGAFGEALLDTKLLELYYWQLKGDGEPGKEMRLGKSLSTKANPCDITELAEHYWERLKNLIIAYENEQQPYLSRPRPYLVKSFLTGIPRFADYAHLARVLEWGSVGEGE